MPSAQSVDAYSERIFGAAAFAAFDEHRAAHRTAAAELHDRLVAIGLGPDRAAALFGEREIAQLRVGRAAYYDEFVLPRNAGGVAARFFILHEPAGETELRGLLGDATLRFLVEMAAVVKVEEVWRSLVSVTWFADRLILTDARVYNVVWPETEPFWDYVMPPGVDSIGLLRVAPSSPRRAALDLCCGAGAQALAAAAYSARVVGVDLNPRALRFARVNAAANRIEHATFVTSDCYDALEDGRFDAILSNPPFVPWPAESASLLFRGGGPRGEDVLSRILAGAVEQLEPRGTLAIVADLADVQTLPSRIRAWQGSRRRTLIILQQRYELFDYAYGHAGHHPPGAPREREIAALLHHFAANAIRTIDFGYILQDGTEGSTHAIQTTAPLTTSISRDVSEWFAHQRRLADGTTRDLVLALAPGLRLVHESVHEPDGAIAARYLALPAPSSVLTVREVSKTAFELLRQIGERELRADDVTGEPGEAELRALIEQGYVRFRYGTTM